MTCCSMAVNGARLDWKEEGRRTKPCKGCGKRTRGSGVFFAMNRVSDALPYCIGCAIAEVTRLGLAPAKKILKQLGDTRAQS